MRFQIILFIALLAITGFIIYAAVSGNQTRQAATSSSSSQSMQSFTELKIEDTVVGTGPVVESGDTVTIHYRGTLTDGTQFDSSYDRGQPFTTQIGVGRVIQGWDQGIVGMKVGGKRKLSIPADLGYGPRAVGSIPANSSLVFETELISIQGK